ncbi:TIGR01457 family HAD-type hydrolase [Paenibacillus gansuensis]|uniref:Acid sugar phosphatase n=1 Tax=Paenibacillus gansuensis TaxID=306542 RepID=A0ABW5PCW2_9BACL
MATDNMGLLIDLDGTVYHGNRMIPFADQWIASLKEDGIPFLFVTNNSSRTPEAVAAHLRSMGIDAASDDVYTAAQAAAQYITEQKLGRRVFCIGESGLQQALQEAGLSLAEPGSEEPVDAVVQGIDRDFTYAKLSQAVKSILDGARSVQTNPDLLLPSDTGLIPGAGTIGAAIQAGSRTAPIVIGKPSPIIMGYALQRLGCAREQAVVIGDNLFTDIGAGIAAGCRTVLVLTGVTTQDNMEEQIRLAGHRPDAVCRDLQELQGYIRSQIRL